MRSDSSAPLSMLVEDTSQMNRLAAALSLNNACAWELDLTNSVWLFTPTQDSLRLYGYKTVDFIKGWDWFKRSFCHPDDIQRVIIELTHLANGVESSWKSRFRVKDKSCDLWIEVECVGCVSRHDKTTLTVIMTKKNGGMHHPKPQSITCDSEQSVSLVSADYDVMWYKDILNSLPYPVAISDKQNRWNYANNHALEFLECRDMTELIGKPSKNWGGRLEPVKRTLTDKKWEADTFHQPTTKKVYQGQSAPLYRSDGHLLGKIDFLHDVTETFESDERMRIMLDSMPLSCCIWDHNFNAIECNYEAAKLFDLPDKAIYCERFYDLSPIFQPCGRPSREMAKEMLTAALEDGFITFPWMHQKLCGEPLPAEITLTRVKHQDNVIIVGYTRDLRELKATQAELDTERLFLKRILDSSPVCFFITVDGIIRFATPFASSFLGIGVGEDFASSCGNESTTASIREELSRNGKINWKTVSVRAAGGIIKEMLMNAFLVDYYGSTGVMIWLMDVTEMRRNEKELMFARDAAEASTKAKSEFLANMSHEIRTPMNAIIGLTNLTLDSDELSNTQREYISKVEDAAVALLRIINDILDFSKIEAGKMEMEMVVFHLDYVLRNAIELISRPAEKKKLEVLFHIPPDLPAEFNGDPLRLGQVLNNLLSNAAKFTERGSIIVKITPIATTDSTMTLEFKVADTGIGISQEKLNSLFSPFTQADTSTTRKYGGTGLGLGISRRLVSLMGGTIFCESVPGKGSVFTFSVKLGLPSKNERYVPSKIHLGGRTVLLISSNRHIHECIGGFMGKMKMIVRSVGSLSEALPYLESAAPAPQQIVLDYCEAANKPNELGTFIEKAESLSAPMIILAFQGDQSTMLSAYRYPRILNKPVLPSNLYRGMTKRIGAMSDVAASGRTKPIRGDSEIIHKLSGAHILLAEDNEVNKLVARKILEKAKFKVTIVSNGREAVEMVKQHFFDIVLMDIQMPEMDGLAATREIRSDPRFKDLPILAMTAHAMSSDRELSLQAGMCDHITKPIDINELYQALIRWLRPKMKK